MRTEGAKRPMPDRSAAKGGAAKGGSKATALQPILTHGRGGPRAEGGRRTPSDRRERGGKGCRGKPGVQPG